MVIQAGAHRRRLSIGQMLSTVLSQGPTIISPLIAGYVKLHFTEVSQVAQSSEDAEPKLLGKSASKHNGAKQNAFSPCRLFGYKEGVT